MKIDLTDFIVIFKLEIDLNAVSKLEINRSLI